MIRQRLPWATKSTERIKIDLNIYKDFQKERNRRNVDSCEKESR
jgi:hypothetical protein